MIKTNMEKKMEHMKIHYDDVESFVVKSNVNLVYIKKSTW